MSDVLKGWLNTNKVENIDDITIINMVIIDAIKLIRKLEHICTIVNQVEFKVAVSVIKYAIKKLVERRIMFHSSQKGTDNSLTKSSKKENMDNYKLFDDFVVKNNLTEVKQESRNSRNPRESKSNHFKNKASNRNPITHKHSPNKYLQLQREVTDLKQEILYRNEVIKSILNRKQYKLKM